MQSANAACSYVVAHSWPKHGLASLQNPFRLYCFLGSSIFSRKELAIGGGQLKCLGREGMQHTHTSAMIHGASVARAFMRIAAPKNSAVVVKMPYAALTGGAVVKGSRVSAPDTASYAVPPHKDFAMVQQIITSTKLNGFIDMCVSRLLRFGASM